MDLAAIVKKEEAGKGRSSLLSSFVKLKGYNAPGFLKTVIVEQT